MEIEFIQEEKKNFWNDFLLKNKGSFLQSFEWGEFQKNLFKKIFRIIIKKNNTVLLSAQVIKENIFFRSYFYLPYGPTFNSNNSLEENHESFKYFLERIRNIAKKEGAIFLRIEPLSPLPEPTGFNFQEPIKRVQPQKNLILKIDKPEQELLMSFRKRTRYNIRLAEKKGVRIKISDKYSDAFYQLLNKTKQRQGFRLYPKDYYKKLLNIQGDSFKTELFLAEYQTKIIVASIIVFFGEKVISLHTGFDYQYRQLKAPYLLRWKTILRGKRRNCQEFDMGGIDEKKYPGVTYLKKSFGGQEFECGPGKEIIFNNLWYNFYKILRPIYRSLRQILK